MSHVAGEDEASVEALADSLASMLGVGMPVRKFSEMNEEDLGDEDSEDDEDFEIDEYEDDEDEENDYVENKLREGDQDEYGASVARDANGNAILNEGGQRLAGVESLDSEKKSKDDYDFAAVKRWVRLNDKNLVKRPSEESARDEAYELAKDKLSEVLSDYRRQQIDIVGDSHVRVSADQVQKQMDQLHDVLATEVNMFTTDQLSSMVHNDYNDCMNVYVSWVTKIIQHAVIEQISPFKNSKGDARVRKELYAFAKDIVAELLHEELETPLNSVDPSQLQLHIEAVLKSRLLVIFNTASYYRNKATEKQAMIEECKEEAKLQFGIALMTKAEMDQKVRELRQKFAHKAAGGTEPNYAEDAVVIKKNRPMYVVDPLPADVAPHLIGIKSLKFPYLTLEDDDVGRERQIDRYHARKAAYFAAHPHTQRRSEIDLYRVGDVDERDPTVDFLAEKKEDLVYDEAGLDRAEDVEKTIEMLEIVRRSKIQYIDAEIETIFGDYMNTMFEAVLAKRKEQLKDKLESVVEKHLKYYLTEEDGSRREVSPEYMKNNAKPGQKAPKPEFDKHSIRNEFADIIRHISVRMFHMDGVQYESATDDADPKKRFYADLDAIEKSRNFGGPLLNKIVDGFGEVWTDKLYECFYQVLSGKKKVTDPGSAMEDIHYLRHLDEIAAKINARNFGMRPVSLRIITAGDVIEIMDEYWEDIVPFEERKAAELFPDIERRYQELRAKIDALKEEQKKLSESSGVAIPKTVKDGIDKMMDAAMPSEGVKEPGRKKLKKTSPTAEGSGASPSDGAAKQSTSPEERRMNQLTREIRELAKGRDGYETVSNERAKKISEQIYGPLVSKPFMDHLLRLPTEYEAYGLKKTAEVLERNGLHILLEIDRQENVVVPPERERIFDKKDEWLNQALDDDSWLDFASAQRGGFDPDEYGDGDGDDVDIDDDDDVVMMPSQQPTGGVINIDSDDDDDDDIEIVAAPQPLKKRTVAPAPALPPPAQVQQPQQVVPKPAPQPPQQQQHQQQYVPLYRRLAPKKPQQEAANKGQESDYYMNIINGTSGSGTSSSAAGAAGSSTGSWFSSAMQNTKQKSGKR
jgi:hypothetical protein